MANYRSTNLASDSATQTGLSDHSAGRVKGTHTRHGNAHLKAALGVAAMSASRTKDTYLAARYRRIATRRGPVRAVVAIERTILTAVWNMLTNGVAYADLGGDYYTMRDPVRARYRAIRQLESLGYQVTVQRRLHDLTRTLVIVRTSAGG